MIAARHIAIALLIAAAGSAASAQEPTLLVGATAGIAFGPQFGSVPVFAGSDECGRFTGGSAGSAWAGVRLVAPSLLASRVGMSITGAFERRSGDLYGDPPDPQIVADPTTGGIVTLDRAYRLDVRSALVRFALAGVVAPSDRWRISVGPWLALQSSLATSAVDTIRGPGPASFADGRRSRALDDATTLTSRPVVGGALLEIAYELPAGVIADGSQVMIEPQASISATLSPSAREGSWRGVSFGAGVAVLFDITPRPAPVAAVAEAAPPKLSAGVLLEELSAADGRARRIATVSMSEIRYRTFTPLLPAIFFDRDASSIAPRYLERPAGDFSLDSLAGAGAVGVHAANLDIVGMRMRERPAATLTLIGVVSQETTKELALARARAVRDALTARWGIDPARVAVATGNGPMKQSSPMTEDGRAENRRVELVASDPSILAPVASDRVAREFDPPEIAVVPSIEAEAGVRRWEVTLRQGGAVVARYASGEEREGGGLSWKIADELVDSVPSPLSAELVVEDSTGATVRAGDSIPITTVRRTTIVDALGVVEADRSAYSLVAFEFDEAGPGPADRALLGRIAGSVPSDARVVITGYTDRIGDEEHNVALSQRRARSVASYLRTLLAARSIDGVEILTEGAGIEVERFGNDLPEARMFSRGVRVLVERR
jgi:outer membrane protein OmpA-like peptidoglycan-associated protein